jgi:signal transduction histidine kinase
LGLIGMHERMDMVGGSLIVKSAPGQGTTVTADIPMSKSPKSGRGSER